MSRGEDVAGAFAMGLAVAILLLPTRTWALMILLGIAHHEVADAITPVGFWTCVPLAFLLSMALPGSSSSGSDS